MGGKIKVDTSELHELIERFRAYAEEDWAKVLVDAVKEASAVGAQAAKQLAPRDTGQLAEQILIDPVVVKGDTVQGGYTSQAHHGAFIEFGTGQKGAAGISGADVDPKAKGMLTYTLHPWRYRDSKGNWHTTIGMKPRPYMFPSSKLAKIRLKQALLRAIRQKLKG